MSGAVRLVSVGAPIGSGDHPYAATIARALAGAGIAVGAHVVVDDDDAALEHALGVDGVTAIVARVGGSAGDSVRRVLARITGARLVLSERMRALLDAHYARLDRPVPRSAERLALLPQGAVVADGDAPVWMLESGASAWIVFLRGRVDAAVDRALVPLAAERLGARGAVAVRTFKTAGATAEEIEDRLVDRLGARDLTLATVPGDGEVWVRVRARAATATDATKRLDEVESVVTDLLGDDCYGRDADSLEAVVGRMLTARGLTLAVAESCSGGLVAHRLAAIAGSSSSLELGVTIDSDRAKGAWLGVDAAILRTHGAVSAPCAEAMARAICARTGAACGLSITEVAGPDGGTPEKPVGTTFIGLAVRGEVTVRRFRFDGDPPSVQWQSSVMALDMLRRRLQVEAPP